MKGNLTMRRWDSAKHKRWAIPAEGFRNHVTTDGSLLAYHASEVRVAAAGSR